MDFYSVVLRKSVGYWVALCLENGAVGQGTSRDEAINRLRFAMQSLEDALRDDPDLLETPVSIKQLHEFLALGDVGPAAESFELRAVYA